jgi:hypothetical protein
MGKRNKPAGVAERIAWRRPQAQAVIGVWRRPVGSVNRIGEKGARQLKLSQVGVASKQHSNALIEGEHLHGD